MPFAKKTPKTNIYLDYASSAPVDPQVVRAMEKFWSQNFSNPSALHSGGIFAKQALESARKSIARILRAQPDEIIFTSGGTESDNLAISGIIEASRKFIQKPHIVTTNIEHSAVLETCKALSKNGVDVTYVPVEKNGIIDPLKLKKAIKKNTTLVSVMYANNEIGSIQPIAEVAKVIRHFKKINNRSHEKNPYPFFHTDAAQAMNYLPINVQKLGIDLLSFNGSKIYGPKGIGALFKKRLVPIKSTMHGGDQEFGLRPGTENVPAIVGLGKALEITEGVKEKETKRLIVIRDYFINIIEKEFPDAIINGDKTDRLPNNVNVSFSGFEGEFLVIELDARSIAVSAKSACKSDDPEESHVIRAIRPESRGQEGSVRFSLGRSTTKKDIDFVVKSLKEIFQKQKKWQI